MKNVTQQLLRGTQAPTAAELTSAVAGVIAALAFNPHFASDGTHTVLLGGASATARLRCTVRDGNGTALTEPVQIVTDDDGMIPAIVGGVGTLNITGKTKDSSLSIITPDSEGKIDVNLVFGGAGAYKVAIRLPYLTLPVASVTVTA